MRIVTLLLSSMVIGCASQQVADESAPASATVAEAQSATGASGADASGQAAKKEALSGAETESSEKAAAELDTLLKSAQFEAVNKNGETVYCKREIVTGSRLQSRTRCFTAAELERIRTHAQDTLSDLSRRAPRARPESGG